MDDLDQVGRVLRGTGLHYELDEGRLILISPRTIWHADVSLRVCNLLRAQGRLSYQQQGVRLAPRTRDAVIEFFKLGPGRPVPANR